MNKTQDWEHNVPCNVCGSVDTELYMHSHVPKWYDHQPLRLVKCANCDLVWPDPRPPFNRILRIQTSEWGKKVFYIKEGKQKRFDDKIDKTLSGIMKYGKVPNTLFDVGFGCGRYMMSGRRLGLECSGNEINRYSCEEMSRRGFSVYESPTADLQLDSVFDIMICHDNIEHTYTPKQDLQWMYDHQPTGGILNIRTLYLGCPRHKADDEHWELFGLAHFHYFFPHVLLKMIKDTGYEIVNEQEGKLIDIIARKV